MKDDSNNSAVGALMGLALMLLLLVGGAGFYFVRERQLAAVQQAERAREAEAEARVRAEVVRAEAAAAAVRGAARGQEPTADQQGAIRAAVESVLRAQEDAWNRGDVDAFASGYWKSPDVTFSSGGKTTRGWEETVRGYRERYPTRKKMGRLSFGSLEITPLGDEAALVLGEWKLERESEPVSGNFSLVFRKIDGRWVIVHDHTSRAAE